MKLEPNPRGLEDHLADDARARGPRAIYYGGYGYATFHFAEAFKALDWDPPRVMGTAFMFYSNTNEWAEGLEGWHGVDQLGEDGTNPNYNAMIERFEAALRSQVRATSSSRSRTTPPAPRSTASPTRTIPTPERGEGRARADPVDAGDQRRPRHATSSSARATTRATRATSSRSASCAAASCASTATTARNGRVTASCDAQAPKVASRMSCSSGIGMRSEPVAVPLTSGSIDWYAESNPLNSMASTSGSPSRSSPVS